MKRTGFLIGALASILVLTTFLMIMAQRSDKKDKPTLVEKYEKIIKTKEPGFKQSYKKTRKEGDTYDYTTLEWKKGGDLIHVETIQFQFDDEAIKWMNSSLSSPVAVYYPTTKLTDLGDEAYMKVSPDNYTQMFIRKGNVYLRLNASTPKLAKRFARYLVDSIDVE